MALEIEWSKRADNSFDRIIDFLHDLIRNKDKLKILKLIPLFLLFAFLGCEKEDIVNSYKSFVPMDVLVKVMSVLVRNMDLVR